jgi:Uma2 family endonuclease
LKKGLEPDECYYIQHAEDVAEKAELDLKIDPPPDLAIEIDISPPGVAREPIYAALGVPEIWRYGGGRLTPLHRTRKGDYRSAGTSLAFPDLPMEQLNRFIALGLSSGQSAAVKALREWVRTAKRAGRKKK